MSRVFNVSQLAEIMRMDRATVRRRLGGLKPVKKESNSTVYDAFDALKILFGLDGSDENKLNEQLLKEQLRHERSRADRVGLEVEKLRNEVVPIEEVCGTVQKEYTYVRATLYSLPSKLATQLALEDQPAKVQAMLHAGIDEALAHLQADNFSEKES